MVGDPMMAMVLQAAGVDSCGRLVTLGPSAPPPESSGAFASSEIALDEANLILMMMIEQHLQVWGRHALPVLFDMYVPRSVVLCPISDAGKKTSKKEEQKEFLEADKKMALVEARSHPRFAAGHVLPKPCISAVYSMAYYTPGVLELLEALANPAKYDQTTAPLSVSVSESLSFAIGRPYPELAAVLLESGAIPLGLLRAPTEASGAVLPYVVAALPNESSLIVGTHDSVYVLAHIENWAPPAKINPGASSKAKEPMARSASPPAKVDSVEEKELPAMPSHHQDADVDVSRGTRLPSRAGNWHSSSSCSPSRAAPLDEALQLNEPESDISSAEALYLASL
mmetsp:Transcript_17803/g.35176  ORF Transcript_17803/g.35176 Transcript_17803/m.35176 type:complete len:340 (+) Transcript_17803:1497-2516(+)